MEINVKIKTVQVGLEGVYFVICRFSTIFG